MNINPSTCISWTRVFFLETLQIDSKKKNVNKLCILQKTHTRKYYRKPFTKTAGGAQTYQIYKKKSRVVSQEYNHKHRDTRFSYIT